MGISKERVSEKKFIPSWVKFGHKALYDFSARYVKDKKVLDCACGEGFGSKVFIQAGASLVIGVDIDSSAVEIAAAKANSPLASFMRGSATNLPFPDSEFDVYISIETIEHIKDERSFLKEAFRVIRPGGLFICSTPNRKVLNPGKKITDKPINIFHVREYSKDEFCLILKAVFKDVSLFGVIRHSELKTDILNKIGAILPNNYAARMSQIIKLPKLAFDDKKKYIVEETSPDYHHEMFLAVCHKEK